MSAEKAVLVGHAVATLPGLLVMMGFLTAAWLFAPTQGYIVVLMLSGLLGFVLAGLWWLFMIPRWRRWAHRQGVSADRLQEVGVKNGLLQPQGSYKQVLYKALAGHGWELVSRLPHSAGWADEHWSIKSRRENLGQTIAISFILSPTGEERHGFVPVWSIRATVDIPDNWMDDPTDIAALDMRNGHFDEKLLVFLKRLDDYRQAC